MRPEVSGIAAAMATFALAVWPAHAQQPLSIGTSPVGSLNHSLGNALGKVLGDKAGLAARVVPYGGGQKILPSMDAKRFDMGLMSASDTYFAYNGQEEFVGKPTKNLRIAGVTFAYYLSWFVRKDAPYKTIADLKGKRVAIGYNSNTAQRRSVLAQMAAAGLTEADFDGVPVPHVVRGADDLAQGKIEATSFAVGAGKVAEVNAKIGGVRYLEVPNTPTALAGLRKYMPMSYVKRIEPGPGMVGILEPTHVQAEDYSVVIGAHVSDDAAYKITKMLFENRADLAAIAKAFERYSPNELARDRGVPFHPGSEKFFKEKGLWPPKS